MILSKLKACMILSKLVILLSQLWFFFLNNDSSFSIVILLSQSWFFFLNSDSSFLIAILVNIGHFIVAISFRDYLLINSDSSLWIARFPDSSNRHDSSHRSNWNDSSFDSIVILLSHIVSQVFFRISTQVAQKMRLSTQSVILRSFYANNERGKGSKNVRSWFSRLMSDSIKIGITTFYQSVWWEVHPAWCATTIDTSTIHKLLWLCDILTIYDYE